uniref:DOMON domain-containing protein n=1 Tax=Caenorhabditis tropicalis TaxID=1561998 RepID=A0A1I7UJG3_9PELO
MERESVVWHTPLWGAFSESGRVTGAILETRDSTGIEETRYTHTHEGEGGGGGGQYNRFDSAHTIPLLLRHPPSPSTTPHLVCARSMCVCAPLFPLTVPSWTAAEGWTGGETDAEEEEGPFPTCIGPPPPLLLRLLLLLLLLLSYGKEEERKSM